MIFGGGALVVVVLRREVVLSLVPTMEMVTTDKMTNHPVSSHEWVIVPVPWLVPRFEPTNSLPHDVVVPFRLVV